MTENTVIPLIVLALTFPTVIVLPMMMYILKSLRDIDIRLSRLEPRNRQRP